MAIHSVQPFLEKMFYPLLIVYIAYLVYTAYSYYQGLSIPVSQPFYDRFYIKKMLIPLGLLVGGFLFRLLKFPVIGSLVIAVPAVFFILKTLLVLLIWLFLAVVFIVFGKS